MNQILDFFYQRKSWPSTPSVHDLCMKLHHRLHNYLQIGLKCFVKNDEKFDTSKSLMLGEKDPFITWETDLQRQMQAWSDNSHWVDQPPEIMVTVPKGSLCNLTIKSKVGLPPDAVFNILVDPGNKRVFKNIKAVLSRKVLVDEGPRQLVEVEQSAIWRFLWWSGTILVHVLVDQDRRDHTVKFKQGKSGFMERFEGTWRVEPLFIDEELCSSHKPKSWTEYESCSRGKGRVGSIVSLEQLIQPAFLPPPPISWYLRGITARTTEILMQDLLAEAQRIRTLDNGADTKQNQRIQVDSDKKEDFPANDIKRRWRLRKIRRIR
ncbi:hypothetical protein HPP92_008041 [Vanilla planifolia]|uniref:DUF220 domain-containing protein n=1 Tax=Vanilla planifolia TaxID=51239 RepID=A0A835RS35_VANPL|nr:hypothetical protein HPP92_008037 [Vanilla planifolia]KAG0491178.1 hypothetical protein HPP92_008041 [Vanilla planifolia]